MIIRYFWRNYNFLGKEGGNGPIDAFWVEATLKEAETEIFPRLNPSVIAESRALAKKFEGLAKKIAIPPRQFCFLVTRDLFSIFPFNVHYTFHQMWNAYSPFEKIPELIINRLDEIRNIDLPIKKVE